MDDEFLFKRDGGEMVPAFHRALANQLAVRDLAAGKLAPACEAMTEARLLFGIAGSDNQWLVDPFRR